MKTNSSIFLTGHNGFVGKSLYKTLNKNGFKNILTVDHDNLDLKNQKDVQNFIMTQNIDIILLCASKMGGVKATIDYPAEFLYDNLMIYSNIIESARIVGVKKLIFFSSSAVYPKNSQQPMKEEYILDGKLHPSNESYAIAKLAGHSLCSSYNKQYNTNYITIISTNLFGPNDNYDPESSNVIPALIKKISDAKINNTKFVKIWGSGLSVRDFLFVDDLSEAILFFLKLSENEFNKIISPINIGSGQGYSIIEIARVIKEVIGYKGDFLTDTTKPEGMKKKILDTKKINELGWKPSHNLKQSIEKTYLEYLNAE